MRHRILLTLAILAVLGSGFAADEPRILSMDLDVRFELPEHRVVGTAVMRLATGEERTLDYEKEIYDAVKKAGTLDFVVGDDTKGVIGDEGIFLVSSSGWYPAVDYPIVFRRIRVDVPEKFRAVTQGGLVSREVKDGREITVWENEKAMDGLALSAGAYVVETRDVDGVKVSTYLFPADRAQSKLLLDETERYLEFYKPLLGDYPWPKFDIVENFFTTGYGMPTYTLLGDKVVKEMARFAMRGGGRIPPGFVDHELVHCWWGNYVYPDYDKGNWCEGLTSYCSNYYRKEAEDPAKARDHRMRTLTRFSIRCTGDKDYPVREFRGKTEDFENEIGYGKASMIFHGLRHLTGTEGFWKTLREVIRDYGGGHASWDDFRKAFSKTTGQDLTWYFDQWLDRKGAPTLTAGEVTVTRNREGGFVVRCSVRQEGRPWRLHVPVVVTHAGGRSVEVIEVDGPETPFEMVVPRPPLKVAIDPDYQVFRRIPLDEIQPCLNQTLGRKDKVFVVPAGDSPYRGLAAMAARSKGGDVVDAGGGLPDGDCVLFGRPEENPAVAEALAAAGVGVEGNAVTVRGNKAEGEDVWLLLSMRHPKAEGKYVTVFFGTTPKALARSFVIFHYGWDGYLLYKGRGPEARGDFTIIRPRSEATFKLPASADRVHETVKALVDQGGRLAGTESGAAARKLLGERLREAGIAVEERPFSFEVRAFHGQGWAVPTVFSKETPEEGVAITGVVPYREKAGPGKLVLLPAERDPRAVFVMLAALAGTKAAAVGIPIEVLEDRRMAALLPAWPEVPDTAAAWLEAAGKQARAPLPDVDLEVPVVFVAPDAVGDRMTVRFTRHTVRSANLVATIPDAAGRTDVPAVGLCAHYDSMGPGYEGADDNASGVAAVLEAAKVLCGRRDLLGRPVRILFTGAEEWGLRGAAALAPEMAEDLTALVSVDTVGARDADSVYLIGRSKHPELSAPAAWAIETEGFPIGRDIDKFAFQYGSDHWPFHVAGVPAIDLFSGNYRRMNSKADTLDLVDFDKVARMGAAAARIAFHLAGDGDAKPVTVFPGEEKVLQNIRMLTDGGENAEAYFPAEDDRLIFQSKHGDMKADQIFLMDLNGKNVRMVSNGKGATTCSYLWPGSKRLLYATTALAGDEPPPPPDHSKGYVWKLFPEFDIVAHDVDGGNFVRLTDTPGYDAEATISRDGKWIVFTSCRDGDPEIYKMRPDGSELTRLTNAEGYDGGPFFSFDGKKIVWRANRPVTEEEKEKYKILREEHLISPMRLEIWVMDADGKNKRQVTNNGAANFGPFFHPDGKRIIFCSNLASHGKRGMPNFDLWMIHTDGTGLRRITTCPDFDGFPMFTADGKKLVFCSNRDNGGTRETNVFLADFVDPE